jgi:lariat debranching enzyme
VLELPTAQGPKVFSYDEEWLAVLRTTHSLLSLDRRQVSLTGGQLTSKWPVQVEGVVTLQLAGMERI